MKFRVVDIDNGSICGLVCRTYAVQMFNEGEWVDVVPSPANHFPTEEEAKEYIDMVETYIANTKEDDQ